MIEHVGKIRRSFVLAMRQARDREHQRMINRMGHRIEYPATLRFVFNAKSVGNVGAVTKEDELDR